MTRRAIICTPYRPSDTTRAAIRLAELLQGLGYAVNLASTSNRIVPTCTGWDHRVAISPYAVARGADAIVIWFEPPTSQWLAFLQLAKQPYVIVHNANFAGSVYLPAYAGANRVMCVDHGSFAWLQSLLPLHDKVDYVPWDAGFVPSSRDYNTLPNVLLPLHDQFHRHVHPHYMQLAVTAASQFPDTFVTIMVAKRAPFRLGKKLKQLVTQSKRVHVESPTDELSSQRLFSHASLVLWPADYDAFGTITQAAAYAGTPVITWRDHPHTSIVTHKIDACLVEYEGVSAELAHRRMWDNLNQLLAQPDLLKAMRRDTHERLLARRHIFIGAWQKLMEEI